MKYTQRIKMGPAWANRVAAVMDTWTKMRQDKHAHSVPQVRSMAHLPSFKRLQIAIFYVGKEIQ